MRGWTVLLWRHVARGSIGSKGNHLSEEKVQICERLQIIQIDSYGDVSAENLRKSIEMVIKIRQERGPSKFFGDPANEISFSLTLLPLEFGEELSWAFRDVRFSVVKPIKLKEAARVLETVAPNRSAEIRTFESVEASPKWLR